MCASICVSVCLCVYNIHVYNIDKLSLVTIIMKCEDATNIDEFAGKVLHHVGRSDLPAVLTLPP